MRKLSYKIQHYYNNNILIQAQMKILIIIALLALAQSAVDGDLVPKVPGYSASFNTSVYSGYLDVKNVNRSIHYVFVQSIKGKNNNDPLTLWLNGGPGCSSLLGFLQEIGPFYMEDGVNYKRGDNLTFNTYSWHNVSNLLFFESPAGVGFSINNDTNFRHNDYTTAQDNFNALIDFFKKYPEYMRNPFWITGQSYAGKYIPDLAVLIDRFNLNSGSNPINFKGIMVGNGIMDFRDGHLDKSQTQYLIDHSFVDPDTLPYYYGACQTDPHSAGCRYFNIRLAEDTDQLNPYNVYGYCYYNDSFQLTGQQKRSARESQQSTLIKAIARARNQTVIPHKFNGAPCAYFDGVFNYFNLNQDIFHSKLKGQKWNGPCGQNIHYDIDLAGSMESYRILLSRLSTKNYQIVLYNGDWDDVVPYHDTVKGIKQLYLQESYIYHPWFTNNQHSGFMQLYSGILFVTVKGASHQVPQSKRAQAFNLFKQVIEGHVSSNPYFINGQKILIQ